MNRNFKQVISILCMIGICFCIFIPSEAAGTAFTMDAAMKLIQADIFRAGNNVDGRGIKVAVLDTGIDIAHPDLQYSKYGAIKVSDWADFTDEGLVNLSSVRLSPSSSMTVEEETWNIGGIYSRSGVVYRGIFKESQLPVNTPLGADINKNKGKNDQFPVILADGRQAGVYDSVWVDCDADYSFNDEKPMALFSEKRSIEYFRSTTGENGASFVITDISAGEDPHIRIGFDGNGHGTAVAGVIAGYGRADSGLVGVAPGAELISVKIASGSGATNWDTIRKGVEYAVTHGADIINLSMGTRGVSLSASETQDNLLRKMLWEKGIILVCAAGNYGPFYGTISAPSDTSYAISVGGCLPDAVSANNNTNSDKTIMFYFSSRGPAVNGRMKPDLVAPGKVRTAAPKYSGSYYTDAEGSSIAAAFISGASALCVEKLKRDNMSIYPDLLSRCMKESAVLISGYNRSDQGYGMPLLPLAFSLYEQNLVLDMPESENYMLLDGTYPGRISFPVNNYGRPPAKYEMMASEYWLTPLEKHFLLPGGRKRSLTFAVYDKLAPGNIYSAFIKGIRDGKNIAELSSEASFIAPVGVEKESWADISDQLAPGQGRCYFFLLPESAGNLQIRLRSQNDEEDAALRMHILPPGLKDGELTVFTNSTDKKNKDTIQKNYANATPGIWQVVVYASSVNKSEADFLLSVRDDSRQKQAPVQQQLANDLILSDIEAYIDSERFDPDSQVALTVRLRDADTKEPVDADNIRINGISYKTRNGAVIFPVRVLDKTSVLQFSVDAKIAGYDEYSHMFNIPVVNE